MADFLFCFLGFCFGAFIEEGFGGGDVELDGLAIADTEGLGGGGGEFGEFWEVQGHIGAEAIAMDEFGFGGLVFCLDEGEEEKHSARLGLWFCHACCVEFDE